MGKNRKTRRQAATEQSMIPDTAEISEEEQWRLIQESGVLKGLDIPLSQDVNKAEEEEDSPLALEIFQAISLIVPFSFLLLMMEILIHYQYGRSVSLSEISDRMISGVPIIALFIFYTSRYREYRKMQFGFFMLANMVGPRLIWLTNWGNWKVNMKQDPPLATLWVYCIYQLDLGPAVLNLVVVSIYIWWTGLKILK